MKVISLQGLCPLYVGCATNIQKSSCSTYTIGWWNVYVKHTTIAWVLLVLKKCCIQFVIMV